MFWDNGGGSGGDSICIGGSCKSCRSDIVRCILCGEDGCHNGGGGVGHDGIYCYHLVVVFVVVEGKHIATTTTINTTTTNDTSNTTNKHSS